METKTGIIFGNYFLLEEEFLLIFKEWYEARGKDFQKDLQEKIINQLENMIILSERWSESKGKTVQVVRRVKEQYDASKIYKAWEDITQRYFGNNKVSLIVAAKFGEQTYQWSNIIEEASVVKQSGIRIRQKGFVTIQEQIQNFEDTLAAQEVQEFLNKHYSDLLKSLGNYVLNIEDAKAMHALLAARKSTLNNVDFHFTGSTYDKIIFDSQKNAEGKRLDAFVNHIGQYNSQLFSVMNVNRINATSLNFLNLDDHRGFNSIFNNPDEVQPWLLDSLNSTSWLSGGDIVVVDNKGAVIYNIQLKTTNRGKTFDLAVSKLLDFTKKMVKLIEEENPETLAKLMFNTLKTTTYSDFVRTEEFYESKTYEMIKQKLEVKKIDISV